MSSHSSEIIIGIDFGTTHSGVSWAINGGSKRIRVISNWPDPFAQNASREKVPSAISYMDGRPHAWGHLVSLTDESFQWFKLLLEENHEYMTKERTVKPVEDSKKLLEKVNKRACAVVADYLRFLWDYTLDDIRKCHPNYQDIYKLRVVLTVPAIWSPAAKDKTHEAAQLAGIPGDIRLVTEPEAAALATLKDKAEENSLQVGDAFVVCDAGGGTVDLISYKVECLKPLKIEECAIGSGDLCGSVFLDTNFEKYIETICGEKEYRSLREKHRKMMMRDFEYRVKHSFNGHDDQKYSVDLRGVRDDPKHGVSDDTITIKSSTLRTVFDPVFLQIENLIAAQIEEVRIKDLTVKAVLLVGGLGANRYLHERLVKCHERDGVHVMQVNGAWSSICRGATLWGLEHCNPISVNLTVRSKFQRYSLGIVSSPKYDDAKHRPEDKYCDTADGTVRARGQMTWLLKRGETVEPGSVLKFEFDIPVQVAFAEHGTRNFSVELFSCEESPPPLQKTNAVRTLCKLDYSADCTKLRSEKSFKSPVDKKRYRTPSFDLSITLGNAALSFEAAYMGKLVGKVEAKYDNN